MTRPQTTVLAALSERLASDPDGPYLDFSSGAGDSVKLTAREMDRLRLRVGYSTDGVKGLDDVRTRVTDSVHAALGIAPDVELVERDVLLRQGPPHKIPRVVKA